MGCTNWSASYGLTNSDEPDRRQVVFFRNEGSDKLNLFKLNQTTNRYFGELQEKEIVGDLRTSYKWGDANLIRVGGTYKSKKRDFESVNFYYDINALNADVTNIYDTNGYLNQENIANGTIKANIDAQPRYNYYAGMDVWAGFAEIEYYPMESLLVNVGLRYEQAKQWVRYWTDGGQEKKTNLDKGDFFPALNLKYSLNETNSLRLSVSRTVTRPSFIEMAPFLYQESYGSAYIRGNNELKNAYNYNIDLRYDFFPKRNNGDMFSVTGYFKKLKSPIEQTQESSGGHSDPLFPQRRRRNSHRSGNRIPQRTVQELPYRSQRFVHVHKRRIARRRGIYRLGTRSARSLSVPDQCRSQLHSSTERRKRPDTGTGLQCARPAHRDSRYLRYR